MSEPFRAPRRALPAPRRRRWWPVIVLLAVLVTLNGIVLAQFLRDGRTPVASRQTTPAVSAPGSPGTPSSSPPTRATTRAVRTKPPAVEKSLQELSVGVVLIRGETASSISNGTGMVIGADGLVVTNYHVVEGTSSLEAIVAVTGKRHPATVVGADQAHDVAVLQLADASQLQTVTFDDDPVAVGDTVTRVGNSNGQGFLDEADGKVLDLDTTIEVEDDLSPSGSSTLSGVGMTDADAHPGDSGGPMYDDEGEVIGMTTAGSPAANANPSETFHIPAAQVREIVDEIANGESRGTVRVGARPYLGVTIGESSTRIQAVAADSPAKEAGMTVGARISGINANPVRTRADLAQALIGFGPGDHVTVHWTDAQGASQVSRVVLAASPIN